MYSKIVNPMTGRKVSVNGKLGQSILKKYIEILNKQRGGAAAHFESGVFMDPVVDYMSMTACTEVVFRWLRIPIGEELLRMGSGQGGVQLVDLLRILNNYKRILRYSADDRFYPIDDKEITVKHHHAPVTAILDSTNPDVLNFIEQVFSEVIIPVKTTDLMELGDTGDLDIVENVVLTVVVEHSRGSRGRATHMILIGTLPGSIRFILDIHGNSVRLPSSGLWLGDTEIVNYLNMAGVTSVITFNNSIKIKPYGGVGGGASGPASGGSAVNTCMPLILHTRGITRSQVQKLGILKIATPLRILKKPLDTNSMRLLLRKTYSKNRSDKRQDKLRKLRFLESI